MCRPARSERKGVGTKTAFLVLLIARLLSAVYNIVHDCDEVYNYWEPLHFLLYGYGLQTWEYRYFNEQSLAGPACDLQEG